MPKTALTSFAVLLLVGCGTVTRTTGVIPLGPDTYRTTVKAGMNAVESERMAFAEGRTYCQGQRREFMLVSTLRGEDGFSYTVNFRCLTQGDPDLVRPTPVRAPDISIEMKK